MHHPTPHLAAKRPRQRGAVLVAVMVIVAIAFILSLTFLGSTTTVTSIANTSDKKLHARLLAESGLSIARQYIESDEDWRDNQPSDGVWLSDYALFDGNISIHGSFDDSAGNVQINVLDASFESESKTLATPLLFPPMSGTVGDWQMTRQSLLGTVTGLTVPQMGVQTSGNALEGMRLAWVVYPTSVIGWASFSQTLNEKLEPDSSYVLKVATGNVGLATLLPELDMRVYSGATLLASSTDLNLLTILDLNTDYKNYEVRFTTGPSPPTDDIRIELYTRSLLGLLAGVGFDNIQFIKESASPVQFTVTGEYQDMTHTVTALVQPRMGNSPNQVLWWQEQ